MVKQYTQANFMLIKPEIDAFIFEKEILKEGVMVRPVAGFGAPDCVRVTIGTRAGNEAFLNGWKAIRKKLNEELIIH